MWIHDKILWNLAGVRAVIYGYDTKLDSSQSFQTIPDFARAFISQLQTYGWSLPSTKLVVFLAHSLGGLVLREAMVQLDNSSNAEYKILLGLLKGAVFFGVPNLRMEQSHFECLLTTIPVDKQMGSQIVVGSDETYHHGKEGSSIFQDLRLLTD